MMISSERHIQSIPETPKQTAAERAKELTAKSALKTDQLLEKESKLQILTGDLLKTSLNTSKRAKFGAISGQIDPAPAIPRNFRFVRLAHIRDSS